MINDFSNVKVYLYKQFGFKGNGTPVFNVTHENIPAYLEIGAYTSTTDPRPTSNQASPYVGQQLSVVSFTVGKLIIDGQYNIKETKLVYILDEDKFYVVQSIIPNKSLGGIENYDLLLTQKESDLPDRPL